MTATMLENQKQSTPKGFGIRHLQVLLMFTGLATSFVLRTNLSVGMVAMTKPIENVDVVTFDWDEATKGFVQSSLYWGYAVTQLPGGLLTRIISWKSILLISMVGPSAITVFTPMAAYYDWKYVCVIRFINGLFQGLIYPVLFALFSTWCHPTERRLTALVLSGNYVGNFLILLTSGYLATSPFGWPSIFYVSTCMGVIWCVLWIYFGQNRPRDYKGISKEELEFLENSSGTANAKKLPIPWSKILTSIPFYASMSAHLAHAFGFFFMLIELPTYLNAALDLNIKSSALLSAVPYLLLSIMNYTQSIISDWVQNNGYLKQTSTRKLFNTFSQWCPMFCLIGLTFVSKETKTIGIVLSVLAITLNAGSSVGFNSSFVDMAPNFVGTLYGISNFGAALMPVIVPILVGFIVTDPSDLSLWRIMFILTAAMYGIGSTIFLIFSQPKLQSWNSSKCIEKESGP